MKNFRNHLILLMVFLFFIIGIPAASAKIVTNTASTVFIGEQNVINKTVAVNMSASIRNPLLIPDPNSTHYLPRGNQFLIDDIPGFLTKWNEKMRWSYSPQQIENYSHMLEDGALKKYQINPDYPTLDVPDMKPFCLEVGNAIGLSNKESEAFAIAADDELKKHKIEFNKPLLPEPESKALTEAGTQSAPFAFGKIDYEYIFVDFTIPSPVPSGNQFNWNISHITDAQYDLYYGTHAISDQSPQQASMSNTGGWWQVTVEGVNTGSPESTSPNGWMENATRNLGYTDTNTDGRVSDDFARIWKTAEGADAVVIVYCTHDAKGAYAAGTYWGYADKAVVSYWGYKEVYFNSVPGSYEHEIVHLFGALDEWIGSSTCGEYSPFAVSPMKEMYKNTNHQNCTSHNDDSVMNYLYDYSTISGSSRNFIGWGDFDLDGELDPLDSHPYRGSKIGVFRNSTHMFYLDYSGNGLWDGAGTDRLYNFGLTDDIPVSGDWNGNNITEIGVFRPSAHSFYLDKSGDGLWGAGDTLSSFGLNGDVPVAGDWNNDGKSEIGVFRPSTHFFYLDYNGNGAWNGAGTDRLYNFGISGDIPVSGDWNGNNITEIGVFRPSVHSFYLDKSGDGLWGAGDTSSSFGLNGDVPVAGDWNHDGKSEIGVFRPSTQMFYLDYNANGAWNGAGTDRLYTYGLTGDQPTAGLWI